MKALVYVAPNKLEYRDEPDPVPEAGEVLVRVKASGICGSDMHAYFGHDERRPAPLILGHEVSGEVVSGERQGQRVVVNPLVTCGYCDDCLSGRSNLCRQRQIISMEPRQGAFSELLRMPECNLIDIPDEMSYLHAALTEPVSTGMHAVLEAARASRRPLAESRVLVLGGGAIGIAVALILNSHGCRNIRLGETNGLRRKTVQAAQVCDVYDPINDPAPEADSWDIVIDAVGGAVTRDAASHAVKPGGAIVHIGLMDNSGGLDVRKLTLQEVAFIGCYTYTMVDVRATVKALHSGALGPLDWVEQRSLSEGASAFVDLANGDTPAAKIVLTPDY
ncbi:MAG: alcohol dehydrogenase catalytic domain-containing protein [Gammaproteobacteria bacterium]|nr:alcohol dehydrogenase catalytic domain-containing protein [Gammaproteobacteria bacterium]